MAKYNIDITLAQQVKLYLSFIRLVREIQPKAFVIENVLGLIGLFGGQIKDSIIEKFTEMGYLIQYKVLCSADYGVPQNRKRVVFVGVKQGRFEYPEKDEVLISCSMALSDLPSLEKELGKEGADYVCAPQNAYQRLMRINSNVVNNHIAAAHTERVRNISSGSAGLTKAEVCHCIFNDLRVTRDNEGVEETWKRIRENRRNKLEYDLTPDIIRYAGDILDYMETANLLKTYDNRMYYINTLEEAAIIKFCESTEWFSDYDTMIKKHTGSIEVVKECTKDWFSYVNRDMKDTDFSTDILSYIANDEDELQRLKEHISKEEVVSLTDFIQREDYIEERIASYIDSFTAKDIGDMGESLIHGHECMRAKIGGREDLIHLIKRIPTQFAVGYDINSVELDERKRYIEVKTTISAKPLHFNRVHLTKNEWNTANSTKDRYYVYRLMLSKTERKLFVLQDPVGLYKCDAIDMIPGNGADITFNPRKVGRFEELLTWRS